MPSFDIVCRVEMQEIDNAVNNTKKAIATRFDFRGAKAEIALDKKAKTIEFLTEDGGKLEAMREMFISAAVRRNLDIKTFDFGEPQSAAAGMVKREVKIREGIEQDRAKEIVKRIKETKLKVQASIQGDEIRVSGKQIDDLRAVINLLNEADLELPLQYVNMKN